MPVRIEISEFYANENNLGYMGTDRRTIGSILAWLLNKIIITLQFQTDTNALTKCHHHRR